MLQFLVIIVGHVLRSSVCVCRAANGGDDGFALFIQVLLAGADFQFCQKRLRGCAFGAGTSCNRSKGSENPKNSLHDPPPCVCRAANGGDHDFTSFIKLLPACAVFIFFQNRLRGCDSRAGTGCNRFRAPLNHKVDFTLLLCARAHSTSPICVVYLAGASCYMPKQAPRLSFSGRHWPQSIRSVHKPQIILRPPPRACATPPMAATTLSSCSFR